MYKHPIRKATGLFLVYSVFIIGIFFLQFRSDSVINKNFKSLRVSIEQTTDNTGVTTLKNRFRVSFNGIHFSCDDFHPLTLLTSENKSENLVLSDWSEEESGFKFFFNNDVSLAFTLVSGDTEADFKLAISCELPKDAASLSLYFKPGNGYSVTSQTVSKAVFTSKASEYMMTAPIVEASSISFSSTNNFASFAPVVAVKSFSFASISPESAYADAEFFKRTVQSIKSSIISKTKEAIAEGSTIAENTATAFTAEMLDRGNYREALELIPDSFKKSQRRTYVSSPYFASTIAMDASLTRYMNNLSGIINSALEQNNLDAFIAPELSTYIMINSSSKSVNSLMNLPSTIVPFEPTLSQATGIIEVYCDLKRNKNSLADRLVPVIDNCIKKIESCCDFDGEKLHLQENSVELSLLQTVDTGCSILQLGELTGKQDYIVCGHMLINSVLDSSLPSDIYKLTELYSLLVRDNDFYPHTAILKKGASPIYVWTCSQAITYEENKANGTATISMQFPEGQSHYLIVKGVEPFESIDIYDIPFRTDARFESYNSSGYVYKPETKTLYLKSRHKGNIESVVLHYKK